MEEKEYNVKYLRMVGAHEEIFKLSQSQGLSFTDILFLVDSGELLGKNLSSLLNLVKKNTKQNLLTAGSEMFLTYSVLKKHAETSNYFDSTDSLGERKVVSDLFLIGITKIRSFNFCAFDVVNHILNYCDHIVISSIETKLPQQWSDTFGSKITLIEQAVPYKDCLIYDQLFKVARAKGATHLLHIDDDDRMEASISPNYIRWACMRMNKGEVISLPYPDIIGKDADRIFNDEYLTSLSYMPSTRDLIFCDDGVSGFPNNFRGCPR